MKRAKRTVVVGLMLAAVVALTALAPSAADATTDPNSVGPERAAALRKCNVKASPFILTTWGDWQLYIYRACMYDDRQKE